MHRDRLLQGAGACPVRRGAREGLLSSRKDAEPACRQTGRKEIMVHLSALASCLPSAAADLAAWRLCSLPRRIAG